MKKCLFFLFSLFLVTGSVSSKVNFHDVSKGQIEVTSENILDFFSGEIKSTLPTEDSDKKEVNKKISEKNQKILESFKKDLPENPTAVSLIKIIDKKFSPLVKKITGIKFTVNKIKKDNDKFVITLNYEIKNQQFLKWLGYNLSKGVWVLGKGSVFTVVDIVKSVAVMYIMVYYIYPYLTEYAINHPGQTANLVWTNFLYKIYSNPLGSIVSGFAAAKVVLPYLSSVYDLTPEFLKPIIPDLVSFVV